MKKWLVAGILVLFAVFGLVACGDTGSGSDSGFKVGMALTGSKTDGGWNQSAYEGLVEIKDKLGADIVFNENTQPSDYEKILRDYAKDGCTLVIGHGFEFSDGAKVVAAEYPDVKFVVTSSDVTNGTNLGSIQNNAWEAGFLQGAFAALFYEGETVGTVGGQEIPPIKNSMVGFDAGAKYISPDIKVLQATTGNFEDANKVKEQSLSMFQQGASILMVNADHAARGAYEAAKEKSKYAIGSIAPEYEQYPETLIACGEVDMPKAILQVATDVKEGNFSGEYYLKGVKDGIVSLTYNPALEDKVPEAVKTKITELTNEIKDGKLNVMDYIK